MQAPQSETLRTTRNWLFRLLKLLESVNFTGRNYVRGNATAPIEKNMQILTKHLESVNQFPQNPKQMIESMTIHRLNEKGFHGSEATLIHRLSEMLNGNYGVAAAISSINDTILYYTLTALDLEDILTLVCNWTWIQQAGKGQAVIQTTILNQLKTNRWNVKPEVYLTQLNQYIETKRATNKVASTILKNIRDVYSILVIRTQVRKDLMITPSKGVFPGGSDYRAAMCEFKGLGEVEDMKSKILKLDLDTDWDQIKALAKLLSIDNLPIQKPDALKYLKEYASQL